MDAATMQAMMPLFETWKTTPVKPTSQSLAFLIINVFFSLIAAVVLTARLYGRFRYKSGLDWDDYWILIATPLGLAMLIFQGIVTTLGSGYDLIDVIMAGNIRTFLFIVFLFQVVSVSVLGAVKISTCCFYLRVFTGRFMRISTWICIGLTGCFSLSFILAVCLLCTPIQANWDIPMSATAKCGDQLGMLKGMIITNIILDIIIMLLPIYTISKLKMRLSEKIGVMACFLIAIVMVVCSIFRLVYVLTVDLTSNITGTVPVSVLIGVLEPALAVTSVSLPMLRPFYTEYRKRNGKGSSSGSRDARSHVITISGGKGPISSSRNRNRTHDDPTLETAMEVEMDSMSVDTGPTHEKTGSEENLTEHKTDLHSSDGITVNTKWEVNVV